MYPDECCPNCGARETNAHLMQCLDKDRTRLLIKNVAELEKWMETDGQIDPERIYWIPKYILMQNNKQFTQLGYMSKKMRTLADSQDKIGWRHFTEGYISTHFTISNGSTCRCLVTTSMVLTGPNNLSPRSFS